MIAKIIVDIPTMQTNRTFDYEVPVELAEVIQKGVRVEVPFGRRKIQGFVDELVDDSDFSGKLKPISNIIDIQPVLNDEMLQLSKWMADTTYSFRISSLQTMLPNVMRAKYHQIAIVKDETIKNDSLFAGDDQVEITDKLTKEDLLKLKKYKINGQIDVVYVVENRAKKKTISAIVNHKSPMDLENISATLPKNAKSKMKLISYFIDNPNSTTAINDLVKLLKVSRSVITGVVKDGIFEKVELETYRSPINQYEEENKSHILNEEQTHAVNDIVESTLQNKNDVFLIEGVTGSGKTEVYLNSIQRVLDNKQTALMLVPEISLTPQMVNRVSARFKDDVAVLHSGLSNGERYDEWRRIERGEAKVVVGARSAIFAPLTNLGVIIIDEEHESSYKQEENPRYHARDIAIWRGKYNHCPVVLGSATPSLESRARAQKGVYHLIRMKKRVNDMDLPAVKIVDMRDSQNASEAGDFSQELIDSIQRTINNNEQAVLMLNKRGYSAFLMCRECGDVLKCPNCDVSLTVHKDSHSLKCHYCGFEHSIPKNCPNCNSDKLRSHGTGTQKVQEQLQKIFPSINILRMDVDTTSKKGSHSKILNKFAKKEASILLGTQMIAKGLDFPDVTLVGVINADTTLAISDFRASERTFQLLTQVSGRAGRANKAGHVIVQTYNPDHYAIQLAATHDYESFYKHEMYIRHRSDYPPFYYTTLITVTHQYENKALKKAFEIKNILNRDLIDEVIILGPTPGTISKINNRYYYQIILKYKNQNAVHEVLTQLLIDTQKDIQNGYRISIDKEPQQLN
ncbi:primosomal protein N' [Companilactobacillus sp. RD055328]|uniref:primosomal protein N' n=1 Tax=Companilactobacillus sp. RD055328 TaxID=2916634 RepID=UPI001FC8CE8E|nr:primosomal protein N' [Companilactobacillus sp. RD055328]GKQ42562.1 primosomal protein N' [Companilactobacillus sp. RD055328]